MITPKLQRIVTPTKGSIINARRQKLGSPPPTNRIKSLTPTLQTAVASGQREDDASPQPETVEPIEQAAHGKTSRGHGAAMRAPTPSPVRARPARPRKSIKTFALHYLLKPLIHRRPEAIAWQLTSYHSSALAFSLCAARLECPNQAKNPIRRKQERSHRKEE